MPSGWTWSAAATVSARPRCSSAGKSAASTATAAPLLLQGRRPYPEHRQFTAGHQRLRRGRYSVRAGGRFLTGALRLHSDLEIYLAKGAVLQGTTNIHDYSPRIPSRFEGTGDALLLKRFERGRHEPQDRPELPQYHYPRQGRSAAAGRSWPARSLRTSAPASKSFLGRQPGARRKLREQRH